MDRMLFRKVKKGTESKSRATSTDYQIIDYGAALARPLTGWLEEEVAERQHQAYRKLIRQAYQGDVRCDLRAAAESIRATGLQNPSTLEVGCASGYYFEILSHLLGYRLRYAGVDISRPMLRLAAQNYAEVPFVQADGSRLPFRNASFDIVFNGVSLMHIVDYESAISESSRVAKRWCIFHTVPILRNRPTAVLRKNVYGGGPVIEYSFNEEELIGLFVKNNLHIRSWMESVQYDLQAVLKQKTLSRTYLCEVVS